MIGTTVSREIRTGGATSRRRWQLGISVALLLAAIVAASWVTWSKFTSQAGATTRSPASGHAIAITAEDLAQILAQLKAVPPGRKLALQAQHITDQDVQQLAHLQNVVGLDLRGAPITDEALAAVATMHGLTRLGLRDTPITTAGIQHVRSLPHLTELDVSHTRINDESLEVIAKIPQLTLVDLSGNNLSAPAVMRMRRSRPDLTVLW